MSTAAQLKPLDVSGLPELTLASDVSFERENDPELPALLISEAPHAGLNDRERSYFFEDQASFVIAAIGLAALDRPFRMTPPDEEGVSRIDTDNNSFVSIRAAGTTGHYTIAANILEWNTTPDSKAIPEIWNWAEAHAEALHSLGKITVSGEQSITELLNEEVRLAA